MQQIHTAFAGPGRTALAFVPTYSMYQQYCRDTFTRYVTIQRNADFEIDLQAARQGIDDWRPSLILIASPNNPTGTAMDLRVLSSVLQSAHAAGSLVVVDEAYAEFRRPQTPSALSLLADWPNLIVSRTMSKAFGLAGARVGYAVAAMPQAVDALRLIRLPYHLSAVTQAVARVALAHVDVMQAQVGTLRQERDLLFTWLAQRGLSPLPSDANFVCFGPLADAAGTWQGLLDRGVLIRDSGPPGYLRVSVGTPEENDRFRVALAEVLPGSDDVVVRAREGG
jgi:histidinol-phosphate aminotransferase